MHLTHRSRLDRDLSNGDLRSHLERRRVRDLGRAACVLSRRHLRKCIRERLRDLARGARRRLLVVRRRHCGAPSQRWRSI